MTFAGHAEPLLLCEFNSSLPPYHSSIRIDAPSNAQMSFSTLRTSAPIKGMLSLAPTFTISSPQATKTLEKTRPSLSRTRILLIPCRYSGIERTCALSVSDNRLDTIKTHLESALQELLPCRQIPPLGPRRAELVSQAVALEPENTEVEPPANHQSTSRRQDHVQFPERSSLETHKFLVIRRQAY